VSWKGYGPDDDTWEPAKNLGYTILVECPQKVEEFVAHGYNLNIFPLPGDVDVI
ncbi:hypothetical protein IFM89_002372, partial [Coptis chinensis]